MGFIWRDKMNRYLLITILTSLFLTPAIFAQEHFEGEPRPEEAMEHEIYMHKMELEERQHQAQMDFGRQSRQIELERRKIELMKLEREMDFEQKMREIELEKNRMALKKKRSPHKQPPFFTLGRRRNMFPLLAVCFVVHILVGVWVYQDIRRRNAGSGLWIALGLLTGLLGALVYAVARLGDSRQTQ